MAMTVGEKISLGFVAVLVLTAILAAIGVTQMTNVKTGVDDLADVHIPLAEAVAAIDAQATSQNLAATLYVVHGEDVYIKLFDDTDGEVDEQLAEAKRIIQGDQDLADAGFGNDVDEITELHDVFVKACRGMIKTAQSKADAATIQTSADKVETAYKVVMGKIDAFLERNTTETNTVSAESSCIGQHRHEPPDHSGRRHGRHRRDPGLHHRPEHHQSVEADRRRSDRRRSADGVSVRTGVEFEPVARARRF